MSGRCVVVDDEDARRCVRRDPRRHAAAQESLHGATAATAHDDDSRRAARTLGPDMSPTSESRRPQRSEWPLVARDVLVDEVTRSLDRGPVVVSGFAGLGKTGLATLVQRRLHELATATVWAAAIPTGRDIPYSAFATIAADAEADSPARIRALPSVTRRSGCSGTTPGPSSCRSSTTRPAAVDRDTDRTVERPVRDLTVTDLDVDCVDEQHRIHTVERPDQPAGHLLQHGIGDPRDRVLRDRYPVDLGEMRGHLTRGQALGGERQHHRVDALEAALPLADRRRFERPITITRHIDLDRAELGDHRLRPGAVPGVPAITTIRGVFRVAEMLGHLDLEPSLDHTLRDVGTVSLTLPAYDALVTNAAETLLEQALTLPIQDRAQLASGLLASLDSDTADETDVEAQWSTETQRRAAQLKAGNVELVSWERVVEHIDELRA